MGKYSIEISTIANKHLKQHKKSGDKATKKRVEIIFQELAEHPYTGIGSPEALKYELSGYWSRKLNQKDRLVYRVNEKEVEVFVATAKGHYDDK